MVVVVVVVTIVVVVVIPANYRMFNYFWRYQVQCNLINVSFYALGANWYTQVLGQVVPSSGRSCCEVLVEMWQNQQICSRNNRNVVELIEMWQIQKIGFKIIRNLVELVERWYTSRNVVMVIYPKKNGDLVILALKSW